MKYGVREICDVVLRAKAPTKIGNRIFYKNEPVIYFDSLKTSSLEGSSSTVYADGGRGNSHLVAWDGDKQVTFTMEDALISAEGLMILAGAGLVEPKNGSSLKQHIAETTDKFVVDEEGNITVYVAKKPYLPEDKADNFAYVMAMKDGEVIGEPFIPEHAEVEAEEEGEFEGMFAIVVKAAGHTDYVDPSSPDYVINSVTEGEDEDAVEVNDIENLFGKKGALKIDQVMVDYYTERTSNIKQIEIRPDSFGCNFYLEASTLFRNTAGVDLPAEFIVPNCKVQSNFTFSMAATGDPSTFTFTMDAFPDYTRFDKSKKVLAAIQIIDETSDADAHRTMTLHDAEHEKMFK